MKKIMHEKAILNRDDKFKIRTRLSAIIDYAEKIEYEEVDSDKFICFARGLRSEANSMLEVYEKRILKDQEKKKKVK